MCLKTMYGQKCNRQQLFSLKKKQKIKTFNPGKKQNYSHYCSEKARLSLRIEHIPL